MAPNNPTGVVYSAETLTRMAELLTEKSRAYGHTIYLVSDEPYRDIAFDGRPVFEEMISAIQDETVRRIFSARIKSEAEVKRERVAEGIVATTAGDGSVKKQPRKVQKIGRNDPCPCGSGKKYKQCCGR